MRHFCHTRSQWEDIRRAKTQLIIAENSGRHRDRFSQESEFNFLKQHLEDGIKAIKDRLALEERQQQKLTDDYTSQRSELIRIGKFKGGTFEEVCADASY